MDPEYKVCTAFDALTTKLKDARDGIRKLKDLTKPDSTSPRPLTLSKHNEEELMMKARNTYLRGSFITVMAMWEGYVQDLLEESGSIVFDPDAPFPDTPLGNMAKKEIIARSVEHHLSSLNPKEMKEKAIALISDIVLTGPEASKTPQELFKAHTLKKATGKIMPVFFGHNGIDNEFKKIFKLTGNLSDKIAQQKVVHGFAVPRSKTAVLKLDTPKGINDIIRLYYGVRCAFAHGRNEKTLEEGGALYNYPKETNLLSIVKFESIEEKLRQLYNNVEKYGSEAWVHYDHLVNLQRFVIALAFQLFKAVSSFIVEKYELTIWNDPKYVIENYSVSVYW